MPQLAVAAAAYWASGAAASWAATTFALTAAEAAAVGALAGAAVSVAGGALINRGKQGVAPSQERTSIIRQPAAARRLIYGEVQVGGVLACPPVTSDGNTDLANLIVIFGDGPIDSVYPVIWVGEQLSSASVFSGRVDMSVNLGTEDQAALASMITERPDVWTTDHRLRGIAHAHIRLRHSANAFPGGLPALRFLVRGRLLYDPRTGLTVWSRNPALVVLDYLRSPLGLRCPDSLIDFDSFAAAANICDEIVVSIDADNVVDGVPNRVRRYTYDGMVDLSGTRTSILAAMENACAGRLVFSAGQYRFHAGAYEEPHPLEITEATLRAAPSYRPAPTRQQLFNLVSGTYLEPRQDWQDADYAPQQDDAAIEADGDEIVQPMAFPCTTTGAIAQRLAKLALRRARNSASLSLQCNWAGLPYRLMDVVTVHLPPLGIEHQTFRVMGTTIAEGGGVDLLLAREDIDDYAWDHAADETAVEAVTRPANDTILQPDPVTALLVSGAPRVEEYGTVPRLSATWTHTPPAGFASYEVQFKKSADPDYADSQTTTTPSIVISGLVEVDNYYDLRVRVRLTGGRFSEWVAELATLVQNDTSSPGLPTALSVTGSGLLTIGWTTPGDSDFRMCRVYVNTSATPVGATLLTSIVGLQLTAYTTTHTPGGTRHYYVSSVDRTGNESTLEWAGSGS